MAPEAKSGPNPYVMGEARPNKPQRDQPPRGTDARVRSLMKQVKELTLELERNQRAERSRRGVTQERLVVKGNGNHGVRGLGLYLGTEGKAEGKVSCRGGRRETSNFKKMGSEGGKTLA